MEGIIIGNISNTYKIETIETTYIAHARGKFKNQDIKPLVGDRVKIELIDEEKKEAIIEEIKTRKNEIKRPKIANIDQIVFIISTKNPKPDLLMLDKQLAYSEKIKIERSYDYLLNGSFVTLEDKKILKSKKFREYLRYVWDNKKERFKNHTAIYALCDFVRKTDYASLKTKFNDMITTKIKHLETISTTILSFDFIPATKTKSMRIISRNGCDDLNSFDLVYFFKCSRNTIQNLLKRKALCYSDVDNKLYSIQYINEYLAKKHSEYIKNNNTKLLPKENNNSGKYTNKLLLLYGFYKDFVNGGSNFEKFLINKDENIQTDLIVRNDIISVFKFFKRNKKVLDSLDNDFISLSSFFYNKDFDLPTFNEDWLPKFIRLLQEYSDSVKDDTSDNMQERLFSYLEAIQVYINSAKEQLKEDNWCTLDEAVKNTPLTKKIIQGLRERNKITYTQYSNKVIKYLKSDIESIKEMRK